MQTWPRWVVAGCGLGVGFALGWLVALLAILGPDVWSSPAWQGAVAWQGWVGSAIGVVGSLLVALVVFALTRRHDHRRLQEERGRFERQMSEEARRFARTRQDADRRETREREAAREGVLEERQIDAFASLAAALQAIQLDLKPDNVTAEEMWRAVSVAFHRWRLVIPVADDRFAVVVDRALTDVRVTMMVAIDRSGSSPGRVHRAFARAGGPALVEQVITAGRRWHSEPWERRAVERDLQEVLDS